MDSVFGAHRLTNKKHFFPTKALVQCVNFAQPECSHVKAHTLYISAKGQKVDSVFGILCFTSHNAFPQKRLFSAWTMHSQNARLLQNFHVG